MILQKFGINPENIRNHRSPSPKGENAMARPVTLFTGQWADLSFDVMCEKAKSFGYGGLELACWGDHFEVDKADEATAGTSGTR
jgi:hypothetical protein